MGALLSLLPCLLACYLVKILTTPNPNTSPSQQTPTHPWKKKVLPHDAQVLRRPRRGRPRQRHVQVLPPAPLPLLARVAHDAHHGRKYCAGLFGCVLSSSMAPLICPTPLYTHDITTPPHPLYHHHLHHHHQLYYANRVYYTLEASKEIDNPDQRIAEDIRAFTRVGGGVMDREGEREGGGGVWGGLWSVWMDLCECGVWGGGQGDVCVGGKREKGPPVFCYHNQSHRQPVSAAIISILASPFDFQHNNASIAGLAGVFHHGAHRRHRPRGAQFLA